MSLLGELVNGFSLFAPCRRKQAGYSVSDGILANQLGLMRNKGRSREKWKLPNAIVETWWAGVGMRLTDLIFVFHVHSDLGRDTQTTFTCSEAARRVNNCSQIKHLRTF